MKDLVPKVLFCPDYFKNKWKLDTNEDEFVWTAIEDDAKMGIVDQHKKEHIFVFQKGGKIFQSIINQKMWIKHDGLKRIEYFANEGGF